MTNQTQTWDGSRLANDSFAFIAAPPDGAPIWSAAHGDERACVLLPTQIGPFLQLHAAQVMISTDIASWFWPLHQDLHDRSDPEGIEALWGFVDSYRMYDLSILYGLLQLAQAGSRAPSGSPYATGRANNTAAAALRYVSTLTGVHRAMQQRIAVLNEGTPCTFGPLGLGVQVQGAIALAGIEQSPPHLASDSAKRIVAACEKIRADAQRALAQDKEARRCFQMRHSRIEVNQTGPIVKPVAFQKWVDDQLDELVGLHRTAIRCVFDQSEATLDDWEELGVVTACHPLLRSWDDLRMAAIVGGECSRPGALTDSLQFDLLPRIRSKPNLEFIHRIAGDLGVQPRRGHVFVALELSDLKLRSLAAVCEHRFGRSVLAGVFRKGLDPVAKAAAIFQKTKGKSAAHRDSNEWSKIAQVLLKAAPMGLGGENIKAMARIEFDLDVGLAKAVELHAQLVNDIYPELGEFLRDDTLDVMASNLGTTTENLQSCLAARFGEEPQPEQLRLWCQGSRQRTPGELWSALKDANANPTLAPILERRAASIELYTSLFGRTVVTLTGRMRGRMLFGAAHRAEYLDLADDAAKSALFALSRAEMKIVAFVNDAIIVENLIDASLPLVSKQAVEVIENAVAAILPGIPAKCRCLLLEGDA